MYADNNRQVRCGKCGARIDISDESEVLECRVCGYSFKLSELDSYSRNSCKDDRILTLGSYPQWEVKDEALIAALTEQAGELPTQYNSRKWTSYKYYLDGEVRDYMWYIDVERDGEKYRGVYFIFYRPRSCGSCDGGNQENNGYFTGKVYWFKWEPIKWIVLNSKNGETLAISITALDGQQYYHDNEKERIIDEKKVYSSNYAHSDIRAWLNDEFYNAAFTPEEKELIKQTHVDNSVNENYWDRAEFVCEDTDDKIFLLSYREANDADEGARCIKITDYARCQGTRAVTFGCCIGEGCVRLRVPFDPGCVGYICDGYNWDSDVREADIGVCPALKVDSTKVKLSRYILRVDLDSIIHCGWGEGDGMFEPGREVTVTSGTDPGCVWFGWFREGEQTAVTLDSVYTFNMPEEDLTLLPKAINCPVELTQNIEEAGTISGVEGATVVGESVTVTAITNPGYFWDGWYENDSKISIGDSPTYTFAMSERQRTLEARWSVCDNHTYGENHMCTKCGQLDGKYGKLLGNNSLTFGSYPQREVHDKKLISVLKRKAGKLPTEKNSRKWTSYRYYGGNFGVPVAQDYMWYIDVEHKGKKYRGVCFSHLRPLFTTSDEYWLEHFQDEDKDEDEFEHENEEYYVPGTVYWYQWEPIEWRILRQKNGEILLLSAPVLDCQQFYFDGEGDRRKNDGKIVYHNNYAHSDLRKWLNDDFYNVAFTPEQKSLIRRTLVENRSREDVDNKFACENTFDYIFALSDDEVNDPDNDFGTDEEGRRPAPYRPTSYAQCQGASTRLCWYTDSVGDWWLRSPEPDDEYSARRMCATGYVSFDKVYSIGPGVRPAMNVKLSLPR